MQIVEKCGQKYSIWHAKKIIYEKIALLNFVLYIYIYIASLEVYCWIFKKMTYYCLFKKTITKKGPSFNRHFYDWTRCLEVKRNYDKGEVSEWLSEKAGSMVAYSRDSSHIKTSNWEISFFYVFDKRNITWFHHDQIL